MADGRRAGEKGLDSKSEFQALAFLVCEEWDGVIRE